MCGNGTNKKMRDYLNKKISCKSGLAIMMGIMVILPMIWLHSIIRINSKDELCSVFYLAYVGIVMAETILYYSHNIVSASVRIYF